MESTIFLKERKTKKSLIGLLSILSFQDSYHNNLLSGWKWLLGIPSGSCQCQSLIACRKGEWWEHFHLFPWVRKLASWHQTTCLEFKWMLNIVRISMKDNKATGKKRKCYNEFKRQLNILTYIVKITQIHANVHKCTLKCRVKRRL